jgi:hypothetical protein
MKVVVSSKTILDTETGEISHGGVHDGVGYNIGKDFFSTVTQSGLGNRFVVKTPYTMLKDKTKFYHNMLHYNKPDDLFMEFYKVYSSYDFDVSNHIFCDFGECELISFDGRIFLTDGVFCMYAKQEILDRFSDPEYTKKRLMNKNYSIILDAIILDTCDTVILDNKIKYLVNSGSYALLENVRVKDCSGIELEFKGTTIINNLYISWKEIKDDKDMMVLRNLIFTTFESVSCNLNVLKKLPVGIVTKRINLLDAENADSIAEEWWGSAVLGELESLKFTSLTNKNLHFYMEHNYLFSKEFQRRYHLC